MFCSNCGKQMKDDDKFCSGCGKTIVRESVVPSQQIQEPIIVPEVLNVDDKKVKSPYKAILFKCILFAIGICTLLEIVLILIGEMGSIHTKVLSSIWWVIIFGILGNVVIGYYERTEYKNLGFAAICLVGINFILTTLLTWEIISTKSEFTAKLMTTCSMAFVCVGHILLLSLRSFNSIKARKVFNITSVIITITYSLILGIAVFEIDHDFYNRICLVFVILTLFGTAATPLVNKIYKGL